MAIVVTAKVLGPELGFARAVGAIVFAIVIGAIMHLIYRKEESARAQISARGFEGGEQEKSLGVVVTFFTLMIGILVFANWAAADSSVWMRVYEWKWHITSLLAMLFAGLLVFRWQWPARHLLILTGLVVVSALADFQVYPNYLLQLVCWVSCCSLQYANRIRNGLLKPGVSPSRSCHYFWGACLWRGYCWAVLDTRA